MTAIEPTSTPEPDPGVQSFLDLYESMDLPELHELSVQEARQAHGQIAALDPGIDLPTVEDQKLETPRGEVPVRFYDPRDGTHGDSREETSEDSREETHEDDPLIVFFHGGGWVVGSIDTHDGACRKLAEETGYPVLSVDYGLAPERPFPEGLWDCYGTVEWVASNADEMGVDSERVVLAGDSAGGNLATATALLSRDRGGPEIAYQVLVYPATGNTYETDSFREFSDGYFLTGETIAWFTDHYFESFIDLGNVYAMPRQAHDLSDLPPATVITAGFDPLRDDGAAYARRLRDAGVEVSYENYEGLIHGFFNMIADPVDIPAAHDAYERIRADLHQQFE